MEVAEEQEARLDWGLSLRVMGEIYLKQKKYRQAQKTLREAHSILEELGSDYEAAKTVLVLARLAQEKGEPFDRAELERAYLTFQSLRAKAEIPQAETLLNQIH